MTINKKEVLNMRYSNPSILRLDTLRRTCIQCVLIVAIVLAATATTLSAQVVVPIGVRNSPDARLTNPIPGSDQRDRAPDYLLRIVPAALGGFAGAAAFGFAATAASDCSGDCYGDIALFISGALFGGILGSAAGAAAPRGRGLCTGVQRFGMGVGGAFLGALAGFPLGMVSGPFGMFVTVPVGSVMFMRRC
jgi:hypothetical protein